MPPELEPLPCPVGGERIFAWFLELHSWRGGTGFGAAPLALPDLLAWSLLTGHRLQPWEIETLKRLDLAWLNVQYEKDSPDGRGGRGSLPEG